MSSYGPMSIVSTMFCPVYKGNRPRVRTRTIVLLENHRQIGLRGAVDVPLCRSITISRRPTTLPVRSGGGPGAHPG